jgi:hypothetical protein
MQTQSEEKKVEVEIQINGEDQAHKEELKDEARDKLLHTHQTPAHKSFFVDPKKVCPPCPQADIHFYSFIYPMWPQLLIIN